MKQVITLEHPLYHRHMDWYTQRWESYNPDSWEKKLVRLIGIGLSVNARTFFRSSVRMARIETDEVSGVLVPNLATYMHLITADDLKKPVGEQRDKRRNCFMTKPNTQKEWVQRHYRGGLDELERTLLDLDGVLIICGDDRETNSRFSYLVEQTLGYKPM